MNIAQKLKRNAHIQTGNEERVKRSEFMMKLSFALFIISNAVFWVLVFSRLS